MKLKTDRSFILIPFGKFREKKNDLRPDIFSPQSSAYFILRKNNPSCQVNPFFGNNNISFYVLEWDTVMFLNLDTIDIWGKIIICFGGTKE